LHRGGLGTELVFQALSPNTRVTARNRDRTVFTGWGIAGGRAGGASRFVKNPGQPGELDLRNTDIVQIGPGDVIQVASGGAGGWGDPLKRDPQAVLRDVRRDWISPERARADYGVVIENGAVDAGATAALRAALGRDGREGGFYDFGPEREAFEAVWTDANYDALTECLAALPVHWRFYAKHRIFAGIEAMQDGPERTDGAGVRRLHAEMLAEFPRLARHAAE
jgi:N-methylhydantoinase B